MSIITLRRNNYTVELANGITYDIPVGGQYKGEQSNAELANTGFHRHESNTNPDVLQPKGRSDFRAAYVSLNNNTSETEG